MYTRKEIWRHFFLNTDSLHENVLQMHGFNYNKQSKVVILDLVISFDEKDRAGLVAVITNELKEKYPDIEFFITLDSDFSD